jgi:hypothetical protein
MDTQINGAVGNNGTGLLDDTSGGIANDLPPKKSSMNIPSFPPKGSIEPPTNLPFADDVDDSAENQKMVSEKVADAVPVLLKPIPKIVPGVRGPLPSAPANPMKNSSAKFGIGTSLKGSIVNKEAVKAVTELKPASLVKNVTISKEDDLGNSLGDNVMPESEEKKSESDVHSILSSARPRIGVPKPPIVPESTVEKEIEELINKSESDDGTKISGKNILPPTAPPESSVDRNIRPRRLAIVVIVLLLFIGAIFVSLWYFMTRKTSTAVIPQPTDLSLFSPEPTTNTVDATPVPSADLLSQVDSDVDGLTDAQETKLGTDPFKADTDGDGYNDKQEIDAGFDPLVNGGKLDTDRDGLADPDEKCWGAGVNNPDSDGDGYLDGQEVINGYDPLIPSPNDKLIGVARCKI